MPDSVHAMQPSCPVPLERGERVLLAHGEGGRLMRRLIRDVLVDALDNDYLRPLGDGAVVPGVDGPIVMTTDSFVVSPLFFPGGDIGQLAVYGTVNDLAVSGATPLYLSLAMMIEEGLPFETLRQVVASVRDAAKACEVPVVTGDTKVVPRGAADGLFLNTTGIGRLRPDAPLRPARVRCGDRVLVNGPIGDHGLAILSAREGIDLGGTLQSDAAPLATLVAALLEAGVDVRFLRDATRGGVSAVLHELAETAGVSVEIDEAALPVSEPVRGACEILGLDPLYVANEGKLVAVVAAPRAEAALAVMRGHPLGREAAIIGELLDDPRREVLVRGPMRSARVLDEPSGAPLPRIC